MEFPAIFTGDHAGIGIVYNLGMGGCKVVRDLMVKNGALLTAHLQTPKQTILPSPSQATPIHWILELEFGIKFLEMQEQGSSPPGAVLSNLSEHRNIGT
jgi:hypothetical protein